MSKRSCEKPPELQGSDIQSPGKHLCAFKVHNREFLDQWNTYCERNRNAPQKMCSKECHSTVKNLLDNRTFIFYAKIFLFLDPTLILIQHYKGACFLTSMPGTVKSTYIPHASVPLQQK